MNDWHNSDFCSHCGITFSKKGHERVSSTSLCKKCAIIKGNKIEQKIAKYEIIQIKAIYNEIYEKYKIETGKEIGCIDINGKDLQIKMINCLDPKEKIRTWEPELLFDNGPLASYSLKELRSITHHLIKWEGADYKIFERINNEK